MRISRVAFFPALIIVCSMVISPVLADVGRNPGESEIAARYDLFLRNLGFEDWSARADEALKSNRDLTAFQREVLKFNRARYSVINDARALAVQMIEAIDNNSGNRELRERVAKFAARMLNLRPIQGPRRLDPAIENMPKGDEKDEAKFKWLSSHIAETMRGHIEAVTADIVWTLAGPKKAREGIAKILESRELTPEGQALKAQIQSIQAIAARIVKYVYLEEMGQTRFAGRALAASLLKYSKEKRSKALWTDYEQNVRSLGLDVRNFVGNELHIQDEKGKSHKIVIEDGDSLLERSKGREAAEITFGVWPGNAAGMMLALSQGLLGAPWDLKVAEMKNENPKKLSHWIKGELNEMNFFQNGFSHVGIARVYEDPETGISMAWARDSYPNAENGGIRLVGILEQFAMHGPYMRFGMARLDPFKMWDLAQKQRSEFGFRESILKSYPMEKNEEDLWRPDMKADAIELKTRLTPAEFEALHSVSRKDAKRWWSDILERVQAEIDRMMVEEGMGFAYGFRNGYPTVYCSQMVWLAFFRVAGIDIQAVPDKWNPMVHLNARMNPKSVEGMDLKARIIGPTGLVYGQTSTVARRALVTFGETTPAQDTESYFGTNWIPFDPKLRDELRGVTTFNQLVKTGSSGIKPGEEVVAITEEALRQDVEASLRAEVRATRGNKMGNSRIARVSGARVQTLISGCAELFDAD